MEKIEEESLEKQHHYDIAIQKLKSISNNKIIRYTLYKNTDIIAAIRTAERVEANSVFVPLKVSGEASNMQSKVPTQEKMLEEFYPFCFKYNYFKSRFEHTIEYPSYFLYELDAVRDIKRYNLLKNYSKKIQNRINERHSELEENYAMCIKRKRVSGAGLSRIFIKSDGYVTPCPFAYNNNMGNIIKSGWSKIKKNLIKFNYSIYKRNLKNNKKVNCLADYNPLIGKCCCYQ